MRGNKKAALIILDGWGVGPPWGGNAILQAKTQNMDIWWRTYAHTTLLASSEAVGLPANTGGNSETGHLNIGAGRVVPQDLVFINKIIQDGDFYKNEKILGAFEHVKKNKSKLHLVGLVGFGHVHSDLNHLYELLKMAKNSGISDVRLDLFTDGRDCDPNSAQVVLEQIQSKIQAFGVGQINFICGRYFAMDRDKNWGRTSRTYNALTKGESNESATPRDIISKSYLRSVTDEFIEPCFISSEGAEKALIADNDAMILFNFRPDRVRQLSAAFTNQQIPQLRDRKILTNLYFVTFVNREPNPIGIPAFESKPISNTLAEVMSNNKLSQFHIAETEKYAHVTYFIDGGREEPFPGEYRQVIPSPKVKTYDLMPPMSADKVTTALMSHLSKNINLIIVNYANADMVGHAGNFYSTVQAIEFVDLCLGRLVRDMLNNNYNIFITSDHGNAEEMINPKTNTAQTEHTTNPVPFVIISKDLEVAKAKLTSDGALANIAPTILDVIGVDKPADMTAESLIIRNHGQQ